jgi:hypothetical protein
LAARSARSACSSLQCGARSSNFSLAVTIPILTASVMGSVAGWPRCEQISACFSAHAEEERRPSAAPSRALSPASADLPGQANTRQSTWVERMTVPRQWQDRRLPSRKRKHLRTER